MYLKKVSKSRLKGFNKLRILLLSIITFGTMFPPNVISQQLINQKINEVNIISKKSFITKAVEKIGPSVVTIDTQRYVKKIVKKFSDISRLIF